MSTHSQPSFFDVPPPKQVADTSKEAYALLQPKIGERQRKVLKSLLDFLMFQQHAPTAYELFNYMERRGDAHDLNDVRPRLTEMKGGDLRLVMTSDKRKCSISNLRVYTWRLTPRGEAYLRERQ